MSSGQIVRILISIVPVLLFVAALSLADTYKLLRPRQILRLIAIGAGVAGTAYIANLSALHAAGSVGSRWYARIGLPLIEECLKAAYLIYLIRRNRIGFTIDAAISGFALGTGFALLENVYFVLELSSANLGMWVVRGLGTAVMHGGTTAIVGILSKTIGDETRSYGFRTFAPGLALAWMIHFLYNRAYLPPAINAALLLLILPVIISVIFSKSEESLRSWVGERLDEDLGTLDMIARGEFLETPAGQYLQRLQNTFEPQVVGDMLCYIQLNLELSARAKGDMLRREMGFPVAPDPTVAKQLQELRYLEQSIGRAGLLAMRPLLPQSSRDLWETQQHTAA